MIQSFGIPVESLHFWLFALAATLTYRSLTTFKSRNLVLLALNIYFIVFAIDNKPSLIALTAFLAVTYGMAVWRFRLGERWRGGGTFAAVFGILFFLFLVRDQGFLGRSNPFHNSIIRIVGISYLVFRAIAFFNEYAYLRHRSPVDFLNYMLFFPALYSGPLARQDSFVQSIETPVALTRDEVLQTSHRIMNGLLKKFVLADTLAYSIPNADAIPTWTPAMLWVGSLLTLLQVYLDFSGYCDISIGIAQLMGIALPENFDAPFLSRNIQEFWGKWHRTLGLALRDHVFMPLVRFSYGRFPNVDRKVVLTSIYGMSLILIGIWHRWSFGFFLYGTLHAAALVLYVLFRRIRGEAGAVSERVPLDYLSSVLVYSFVSITLTFALLPNSALLPMFRKMIGV